MTMACAVSASGSGRTDLDALRCAGKAGDDAEQRTRSARQDRQHRLVRRMYADRDDAVIAYRHGDERPVIGGGVQRRDDDALGRLAGGIGQGDAGAGGEHGDRRRDRAHRSQPSSTGTTRQCQCAESDSGDAHEEQQLSDRQSGVERNERGRTRYRGALGEADAAPRMSDAVSR